MKVKIGIWGSCVSRDIFRTVFNDYKEYFEIVFSLERISLISMMGNEHSIEFNDDDILISPLDNANKFRSEILKHDLSKDYLKHLGENIDFLIIDELFEAYFGVIKVNDDYITNNYWDYPDTKFYETIIKNNKLSLNDNFIEYFALWKKNCDKFFDYFHEKFPDVKIILNKVLLASKFLKDDGSYYVDEVFQRDAEKYNPLIKLLEHYLEKYHGVLVVDCTENLVLNENHIGGKGRVHYTDEFYNNAFEKILDIINKNPLSNKKLDGVENSEVIDSKLKLNQEDYNELNDTSLDSKVKEYLEIKRFLFEEASINNNFIGVDRLKDYFDYIVKNNFLENNLNIQKASFNELIKINKFICENKDSLKEEMEYFENKINSKYFNENAEFLIKYMESRVDIKNYGNNTNNIIILNSDSDCNITQPSWFNNNEGVGTVIRSVKGDLNLSFKCLNDGNLAIEFKSIDYRDKNGNRVPIYIDYSEIVVNDEVLVDGSQVSWHDSPFIYEKEVVDGEIININIKWNPISYDSDISLERGYEKLINTFYSARFDVKNIGHATNDLILMDCNDSSMDISKPSWFKNNYGVGTIVSSKSGNINMSFKCVNDGQLEIYFRALDLRDSNNRIPIFIDYTKMQVDGVDLIGDAVTVWHDKPFVYKQNVKDNQVVNIHAEWQPLSGQSNNALLQENINYLNIYSEARIDIKNYGNETNSVILFNKGSSLYQLSQPKWFNDLNGQGFIVTSSNKELNLSFKCKNDGNLKIDFKSVDFRDVNNNKIPIYIDYKEIEIDGEPIIKDSTVLSYDNSLCYDKEVKDGQIVNIKLKWQPLSSDSNCQNMLFNSKNKNKEKQKLKNKLKELKNENKKLNKIKNKGLGPTSKKTSLLQKILGSNFKIK